jgi:hypothetical protein
LRGFSGVDEFCSIFIWVISREVTYFEKVRVFEMINVEDPEWSNREDSIFEEGRMRDLRRQRVRRKTRAFFRFQDETV